MHHMARPDFDQPRRDDVGIETAPALQPLGCETRQDRRHDHAHLASDKHCVASRNVRDILLAAMLFSPHSGSMESRRCKPCVSHCTQLARHRAVADLPSGVTSRQETLLLDVYDVLQTPDVPVAGVVRPLDAARVPSSSDTVPNLLYVGRDSATLALLERVAASESCGIASVSNGIGALRLMRGGGYDVVVTQSDLPVEADLALDRKSVV